MKNLRSCIVCEVAIDCGGMFCAKCGPLYDRACERDMGAVAGGLVWAVTRVRASKAARIEVLEKALRWYAKCAHGEDCNCWHVARAALKEPSDG